MPEITSPEENKAVIRRLIEEVDKGNLAVVDECFADDYVDHNPTPIRGLAPGIEGVKKAFNIFWTAFPDTRHVIEDLVAEGDKVVARYWACGTHTGELMGISPTGKQVTMTGIAIYRLAGGKIVERWVEQGTGVLQQLGVTLNAGAQSH
jgi:predicted ester cyclase